MLVLLRPGLGVAGSGCGRGHAVAGGNGDGGGGGVVVGNANARGNVVIERRTDDSGGPGFGSCAGSETFQFRGWFGWFKGFFVWEINYSTIASRCEI